MYKIKRILKETYARVIFIVRQWWSAIKHSLIIADVNDSKVGLVYVDGVLHQILRPGSRHLFCKPGRRVCVELIDIQLRPRVPSRIARMIVHSCDEKLLKAVGEVIYAVNIKKNLNGLLYVDGRLHTQLSSGIHGLWRFHRDMKVKLVDESIQIIDVDQQVVSTYGGIRSCYTKRSDGAVDKLNAAGRIYRLS